MNNNAIELLKNWYIRIRTTQRSHYEQAGILRKRNRLLGIPVVILSTIVGTTVFASLAQSNPSVWMKIILGMLSVSAAVLASLQTFLNYAEKEAAHLQAATRLSSLKKFIEEVLALSGDTQESKIVESIRKEWDTITTESPLLSQRVFEKNYRKFKMDTAFPVLEE